MCIRDSCTPVLAGFDPATATGAPLDPVYVAAIREFDNI